MSNPRREPKKRTLKNHAIRQVERLEGRALLASIAEFGLTSNSNPAYITSGPNGNLWFTERGTDKIGETTTSGTITEFALTSGSNPQGITTGPDGNLWFAEYGTDKIGEITTGGTITEYALTSGSHPQEITTGSNGNLWFTENGTNKIGEIVPSGDSAGTITEFALANGSAPYGITSGPNGNLWFTENGANKVGQIVPSGTFAGTINTYSLSSGAGPEGITTGSDGNLWFAENGGSDIGQVTLGGSVTEYSIPGGNGGPREITSGPLGDLYFTELTGNNIVQMTTQGAFTDFAVPASTSYPIGITQGPDNHIWFAEYNANKIGRLNLNPTAVNDTYTTAENTNLNSGSVLANDTDPENDPLHMVSYGQYSTPHGLIQIGYSGTFIYYPNNGYVGTDTFTYQATDGSDSSNTATVTFNVDGPPVAINDTYTTPVSTTLTVSNPALGVLANDTDPNTGHTLTSTVVANPSHGTVTLNSNGSFTYIPTAGYHGSDSFTYHATDSDGVSVSNTATVNLAVDSPAVATNDSYTTDAGTLLTVSSPANGVLANDTAYNGDTLTVASANTGTHATAHGSITMNANGTFTYTPTGSYTGSDTYSYNAYDGYQNSTTPATITFTINALPTAAPHTYEVATNGTLNIPAPGVLAGATGTGSLSALVYINASDGTFSLNSNGSFTYIPTAGFSGTDYVYYKVSDGIAESDYNYITLKVDAPPTDINHTYLVAEGSPYSVNAANGVVSGNTDTFNTTINAYIGTNPSHGSLTWGPNDGSFIYTPANGFHGVDSFTYYTYDGFAYSNGDGTVTLNVDAPPVVVNKSFTDVQNTSLNLLAGQGLLVGATDADSDPLTAVDLTQPTHGTVTLNANGSFSYIPTAGYYGPDSFTYTANDGYTNGNTGTVSVYVDQPPVGVADHYNVVENTSLNKNAASGVLANDTETNTFTNPVALSAGLVTTTNHGVLTLFQDGSFTYTPTNGYYGDDSFTYQANDGITDSPITTVTIHVDAPPVGVSDSYNATQNVTLNVNAAGGVLANDSQAQGETLTASLISNATHGALTLYNDGSFSYVPNAGYYGTDSFTYKPYDGIANGNLTTVNIRVDAPPVVTNDTYPSAIQNTTLTVNAANGVLANDTQPQGEPLTAIVATQPSHGTLTLNADGSFTYVPTAGYYGPDSFTYNANDGYTNSVTVGTVTIQVDAVPVAVDDSYYDGQDTTLTLVSENGVLLNDSQAQGHPLTATVVTNPSHGMLTLNADGSFSYVPSNGFSGTDTFTYSVSDGTATSNVATATITVFAPPVALDDNYYVLQNNGLTVDAAQGVMANDSGQAPIESYVDNNPAHGTVTLNTDGSFTYTPADGYYGSDSFTYTDYIVVDSAVHSTSATVSILVVARPLTGNDNVSGRQGIPLAVDAADGTVEVSYDPQGLPLTSYLLDSPSNGSVTLNSDGSFLYTPNTGFYGTDTFTFNVTNGYFDSTNVGTVTITVAPDHAPVANNVSQLVGEGGITVNSPGILTGDTDQDDDPLTALLVAGPAHGTLTFNGDGSYVYVPNPGFGTAGTDSFTYRAFDGVLASNLATVTLTFDGNYYAPVAQPQSYGTAEGSTLTVNAQNGLLAGDSDYWNLSLNANIPNLPTHGTLAVNPDGSFTYTPNVGFYGTDSFTYVANNGHVNSSTQTVTLNVSQVAGSPVAANDSYAVNEATPLTIAAPGVLANDSDPNSDPLSAILVTNPAHGSVAFNADGSFVYTPAAGYYGPDSFTYKDNDGHANSNTATVSLTVNQVYYSPVTANDTYTLANGQTLTISTPGVLANDTDPNGLTLNSQLFGNPTHDSSFTFNNDGSFTYTPTPGFVGTDSFTYKAADGQAISSLTTVTITVTNPLTVTGTTASATAGTAFTGNVGSFTDADPTAPIGHFTANIHWGDSSTTVGTITQPGGVGTAFQVSGTHTYSGPGSLTASVVITDDNENSASANTTVTVGSASIQPPVAFNDSYAVNENATLTMTSVTGVLANDTDPQSLPLTAILVTNPAHGSVAFNADGSFTYIPAPYYYGADSFTYKDNDGSFNGNTATVNLTVAQVQYAPVAVADSYTVAENATLSVPAGTSPLVNDSQPQGDPFFFYPIDIHTSQGGLILMETPGTGAFTYQPAAGFVGTDTFQYKDIDSSNNLSGNIVTVTITVTPTNPQAPVALNDSQVVGEGGFTASTYEGGGDILANDTDQSVTPLTALLVSSPSHGSLTFNADGTYVYIPNAGFGTAGSDSFTYRAFDGSLLSNVATVTLTFDGNYDQPVAQPQSFTVAENGTLTAVAPGLLAGANDYWNLSLTALVTNQPTHGMLVANADGSFAYSPNAGYFGTDSFTYKVNNGHNSSTAQTVTITVTHVNQPPVAVNDSYSTTAGQPPLVVSSDSGVLANDTEPDMNPITAYLVSGPAHGSLVLNANGSFVYTAAAGYSGTDSFSYRDFDGQTLGNVATATLTVNPKPVPPPAVPGDYDGDGKADIAVYIPSLGAYDIKFSGGMPEQIIKFGTPGLGNAIPAPGDYDHSGKTELAVYVPASGDLIYRPANGGPDVIVPFGTPGFGNSIPAPGDYFGTGQTDVAVYLPSMGVLAVRNPISGIDSYVAFGTPGFGKSIPTPGDYDGSGKTEVAVYLPAQGAYAYRPVNGGADQIIPFGIPGTGQSIPMPGDYDGSGKTEVAVYMPSQGRFAFRPANGGPDVNIPFGTAGAGQTLPSPGDYTGVGHDELAVYIPASGTFIIRTSGTTPDADYAIGIPGLGQTIPVTVVDEALAQMPTGVSGLSIALPDLGNFTTTKKKNNGGH